NRDVGYITGHGTSTKLNDAMETAAVKRVFGAHARDVQLSSIKSMIGHSIGASGAIEAAALALSLHTQVYPPTINLKHPDPQCDLDYIPNTARQGKVRYGLSTSFGFGGQNGHGGERHLPGDRVVHARLPAEVREAHLHGVVARRGQAGEGVLDVVHGREARIDERPQVQVRVGLVDPQLEVGEGRGLGRE